jgi:hypothetical protein
MIVLYQNQRWELDMPYLLFESLKANGSSREVEITELTNSTYKRVTLVPINKLEDYSVVRNLNALNVIRNGKNK